MYSQGCPSRNSEHLGTLNFSRHAYPALQSLAAPGPAWIYSPRFRTPKCYPSRKYVAVAAQVVHMGTVTESSKQIPMVARVSMTDYRGNVLLDTYVRPTHPVADYRTAETGLQYAYLYNAPSFQDVQRRVSEIIENKILIGHCLWTFLSVLGLSYPALDTRDLALFLPLRRRLRSKGLVSLSMLVHRFMGRNIGLDYEDPLENARASIDLFRSCEDLFEEIVRSGSWPCDLPPSSYADCFY